jgi:hypothetical protein
MNKSIRMLVGLAGVAALSATSQAVITLSNASGPAGSVVFTQSNEALFTPTQLSEGAFGVGPVTDTGSFDVTSTSGLNELQVGEVSGLAAGGILTLTVLVNSTVIYSDSSAIDNPLMLSNITTWSPTLPGTNVVSYTATFSGANAGSIGYLGGFTVDAYEAVPEPASYAAMGIGMIGLIARRRRNTK